VKRAVLLLLAAIALVVADGAGRWFHVASPPARDVRALNAFFADLHPGMTEAAFGDLVSRYQFKDGVALMPILGSIHDPSRHFDTMGHGIYAFHFDRDRRLTGWEPWVDGTYSTGTITPSFLLVPSPANDAPLRRDSK
jgi:hypothetical protein